jgi:hypothetical protein
LPTSLYVMATRRPTGKLSTSGEKHESSPTPATAAGICEANRGASAPATSPSEHFRELAALPSRLAPPLPLQGLLTLPLPNTYRKPNAKRSAPMLAVEIRVAGEALKVRARANGVNDFGEPNQRGLASGIS